MKKRLLIAFLPLLLTACTAAQPETEPVNVSPEETFAETAAEVPATMPETTPEEITETETAAESQEPQQYSGEPHVFDECGVLDAAALAHYNAYLEELADSRLICTAAVITDSLGGAKPESYAQNYYRNLYGTESGFLVLVNNDTGQDVIYREGVCSTYITDTALPIAQATPHLVEGDYAGALDILLKPGENLPEYIYDRTGSLSAEQMQTLLETAQTIKKRSCLLLTKETPSPEEEQTPEQALAAYAEEIRSRLGAETLLVADTQEKRCVIAGKPPELLASEVQEVWGTQGLFDALVYYYEGLR